MTKVPGKEYAEMGITVNALASAVIRTLLVNAIPGAGKIHDGYNTNEALPARLKTP